MTTAEEETIRLQRRSHTDSCNPNMEMTRHTKVTPLARKCAFRLTISCVQFAKWVQVRHTLSEHTLFLELHVETSPVIASEIWQSAAGSIPSRPSIDSFGYVDAGPKVDLHATHERALEVVKLGDLKRYAASTEGWRTRGGEL